MTVPPQLLPAGPGALMEASAILNGTVDMRTYGRRYLTVYAVPKRGVRTRDAIAHPDAHGVIELVTTCVEWLDENFDFEVVSTFTREAGQLGGWYGYYAMLRRRTAQPGASA